MKVILGIQEAHDASAAVMVDGRIVAAAQEEERFTGLKGDYGFPRHAIAACLREAGLDIKDIDEVVLAHDLQELSDDYIEEFTSYVGMDRGEFLDILERWRNKEIWKRDGAGRWFIPGHLEE